MALQLHLDVYDTRFRPSLLKAAGETQEREPPAKRLKLSSTGSSPNELITLWDVEVVLEYPDHAVLLNALNGLVLEDIFSTKTSNISTARINVGVSNEWLVQGALLSVKKEPTDYAHQALLYMLAMSPTSSVVKSMHQVYEHAKYVRQVQIKDSLVCFVSRFSVAPLLQWSQSSISLNRNKMFSFFIDLMYPDQPAASPTVSDFYSFLKPPAATEQTYESPFIKTGLMHYQRNAVHWMLQRELGRGETAQLWLPYKSQKGSPVFMQKILGLVTKLKAETESSDSIPGGLLADEMGLGKSLAIIALAVHNQMSSANMEPQVDHFTGNTVKPIGATLVVSPPSILQQWLDEVAKHSSLRVCHYRGMAKTASGEHDFTQYDIVVTAYDTLAAEVYHATPVISERKLRTPSLEKRKCPLVLYEWFRVVMDEAQMIATGSSAAAQVACQIPRKNAWIVTGTPISKSCADTFGLLHFLRIDPIYANASLYNRILDSATAMDTIERLFKPLSCRNTKALVSAEMALPQQTMYLCPVELTAIEASNFNDLLDAALEEIGISKTLISASDDSWTEQLTSQQVSLMQAWISRLRQACTHPYIGGKNKASFAINVKPLQTLADVLDGMIDATNRSLEVDRRARATAILRKGQILEYTEKHDQSLKIWQDLLPTLQGEVEVASANHAASQKRHLDDKTDEVAERAFKLSLTDLRHWRELLQRCYFFIGSAHFQLNNEDQEKEAYANAKQVRKELLAESEEDALAHIARVVKRVKAQDFVVIPEIRFSDFTGGFSSRPLLERLQTITEMLNDQAGLMDEWRESCLDRLKTQLPDQNDEASGGEYEESLDKQSEASDYHDLVRIATADRMALVNGLANTMVENDARALAQSSATSEIVKAGLAARNQLIPKGGYQQWDSLVAVVNAFKAKVRQLEHMTDARTTTSAKLELDIAVRALEQLQKRAAPQLKCCEALKSEFDLVVETLNARLLYYKQLQGISDGLTAFTVLKHVSDGNLLNEDLDRALGRDKAVELEESDISDEERASRVFTAMHKVDAEILQRETVISKGQTRKKYLRYLGTLKDKEKETCTICITEFDKGVMTVCGHIFCRECFKAWFRQHRACPLCKKLLDRNSSHSITLKNVSVKSPPEVNSKASMHSVEYEYPRLSQEQLAAINHVTLVGSYSSKIDTIVKHIISIPDGQKAVLYSNWLEVLSLFSLALDKNGVKTALLGQKRKKSQPQGLEAFMNDPKCKVLLMSGKSQSSGLTLVNATHLFLVEPLLNQAVEQQVMSRIHRFGQTHETSVYRYTVEGSVEMTILKENARLRRQTKMEVAEETGPVILGDSQYKRRLRAGEVTDTNETIALFKCNFEQRPGVMGEEEEQDTLLGPI